MVVHICCMDCGTDHNAQMGLPAAPPTARPPFSSCSCPPVPNSPGFRARIAAPLDRQGSHKAVRGWANENADVRIDCIVLGAGCLGGFGGLVGNRECVSRVTRDSNSRHHPGCFAWAGVLTLGSGGAHRCPTQRSHTPSRVARFTCRRVRASPLLHY